MENEQFVTKYLLSLNIDEVGVLIYKKLLTKGEMTILQLSRSTGIERTKLYRLTETLKNEGLIVERLEYNKRYLQASPLKNLEIRAKEVIAKSAFVSSNLFQFINIATAFKSSELPTNVKFYHGPEGIKQVLWNQLKADKEICAYSYRNLKEIVEQKFFDKWKDEVDRLGIIVKDLRSDEFTESAKKFTPSPFKGDIIKYISSDILDISIELDIYNDTVVIFNWYKGDEYAVEITDNKLSKMQKQIFDMYWKKAKRLYID